MGDELVKKIDDLLPQTQCGQCGHAGCRPYAKAIAEGEAHNKCPPGGMALQKKLAALLNRPSLPLDIPEGAQADVRTEAIIHEDECIGCTKCIQACPVDAIVGAPQLMHTVISHECTGCELCVEVCPVDCIEMVLRPETEQQLTQNMSFYFRERFDHRNERLEKKQQEKEALRQQKRATRQQLAKHISSQVLDEAALTQLKADFLKQKNLLKQIEAAIAHFERHGHTPSPQHLAQRDQLRHTVAELASQLNDIGASH